MTTSEFIKMLQEADPSGNAHVRMEGGIPMSAVPKPGYWDGPYSFIDDEGNYVYTTKESKVDIYCLDIWDFVERHEKLSWDEVKEKFKFDLTYSFPEQRKEREDVILKEAKEAYDSIKEIHEQSYQRSLSSMIENAEKGWRWFQNKDVELGEKPNMHIYYTWKIFKEDGSKINGSNVHMTEPVLKSGLWEKIDSLEMEGYYEWIYKNNK